LEKVSKKNSSIDFLQEKRKREKSETSVGEETITSLGNTQMSSTILQAEVKAIGI